MKNLTMDSLNGCFRVVRTRRWLYAGLAVLLALGVQQIALSASMTTVKLVTVNNEGTDSGHGGGGGGSSISADSRFVAFTSAADDLVAKDTNGVVDVFVRDLQRATTTLVSVNKEGTDSGSGNDFSSYSAISANGRFVVFDSLADDLVTTDTNGVRDVFVRDLQSETTTLISVNKDGTDSGTGEAFEPSISADGRFVAFRSYAADLVAPDTNGREDVFVRDLQNGITILVSINKEGTDSGAGGSFNPSISADGQFVVFESTAPNLVATDTNGDRDVFVRDLQSGTTTLISINKDGTDSGRRIGHSGGVWGSFLPVMSTNNRFVAFTSSATDLVSTYSNSMYDVFVRDLQSGTTTLVSVNTEGTGSGYGSSGGSAISADGRFVAFHSSAPDLVDTDTNGWHDVFVRDLQSGTTTLVSVNKEGTDSGAGASDEPSISADGRFVVFDSVANDLVATDTNGEMDVFVRDLQSGTTTLISVNKDGTDSGSVCFWGSYLPVISADGRIVVFESCADDLVATDTNGASDIFVSQIFQAPQGCNCDAPGAIKGTSDSDFLYGTEQTDIICGFGGQDFIAGLDGDDCIDGGDGNDWIDGGRGSDTIYGGAGKDLVYGDRGNDKISGDEDEDFLFGGAGDDMLDGGDGYDWLFCGRGTDEGIGEHVRSCEH